MFKPMLPSTIERRAIRFAVERKERRELLLSRLREKDRQEPGFIWGEMLREMEGGSHG
jgi:hypothetical protein